MSRHKGLHHYVPRAKHKSIVLGGKHAPSKQSLCICGSGRKFGKCCKPKFALLRAGQRLGVAADPVQQLETKLARDLARWQAEQAKPKWQRAI